MIVLPKTMTGGHVLELTLAIMKPDLVARARDLQVSCGYDVATAVFNCVVGGATYFEGRLLHC